MNDWDPDLYDFLYREYQLTQGRWVSPDPAGLAAVNPADPQSWNRYAYVRNNPTSLTDPSGLFRHCPYGDAYNGCLAPDDANSVDTSGLWDLLNGFVYPPEGGGSVGRGGAGGGTAAPSLSALASASKARIIADLQKPACAKDFQNVGACTADLNNIGFKAGPINLRTTASGQVVPAGGSWVGKSNSITGSITLNSNVNWASPNQTSASLNGRPYTYQALYGQAALLGLPSTTNGYSNGQPTISAADYMDITILHELEHLSTGLGNPDNPKVEQQLWNDCVK